MLRELRNEVVGLGNRIDYASLRIFQVQMVTQDWVDRAEALVVDPDTLRNAVFELRAVILAGLALFRGWPFSGWQQDRTYESAAQGHLYSEFVC